MSSWGFACLYLTSHHRSASITQWAALNGLKWALGLKYGPQAYAASLWLIESSPQPPLDFWYSIPLTEAEHHEFSQMAGQPALNVGLCLPQLLALNSHACTFIHSFYVDVGDLHSCVHCKHFPDRASSPVIPLHVSKCVELIAFGYSIKSGYD